MVVLDRWNSTSAFESRADSRTENSLSRATPFSDASRRMNLRTPKLFAVSLSLAVALLAGCQRETSGPDLKAEVDRLTAELTAANQKLAVAQKEIQGAKDELALAAAGAEAAKRQAAEENQAAKQKDARIAAQEADLAALRKSDSMAFIDASAQLQKGASGNALERYQKFVVDFPESPLIADAKRAITELTPVVAKDEQWKYSLIDPRRGERELVKRFEVATPEAA